MPETRLLLDTMGDNRKSIRIPQIESFSWCPYRNLFFYQIKEKIVQYGFIDIPS